MSESPGPELAAHPQNPPASCSAGAPIEAEPQDERDCLLQIAREMAGVHDLDRLLQMIVDAALRIVPSADKCVIHLLSDDGARLLACVCSSPSPVPPQGDGIPAGQGIAGRALRERTTIYVADTHNATDFLPLHSSAEVSSLLVAALYAGQEALGTLSLSSSQVDAFHPAERQFANTLAAQAAVAIHQARLMTTALAERERSDAVLASISEGLAVLDDEGRVVRVNPALCEILQLNLGETALPCAPEQFSALARLLDPSGGEIVGPYEIELEVVGRRITVRATVSPIQSPAGGQVVVVRDTTADRAAAQSRSLFISQMSHELRTPLQHILSFVSLAEALMTPDDGELEALFGHIEGETYHLARLVDDLMEVSRLETGRFTVRLEPLRLDTWIEQVAARLAPRARQWNHTLVLEGEPEAIWCQTDPLRVEQVLTNLVENACKYVPVASTVRVRLKCSADSATVQVIDEGPGIPAEQLESIFGAFYQIDGQANARGGMGLGLYISREIMRALRGDIWVDSQVGMGSVFSFRLPRLPRPTPPAQADTAGLSR